MKRRRLFDKLPSEPVVEVKPYSYQPSKAELETDVCIPTTAKELALSLRDVTFLETEEVDTAQSLNNT